MEPVNVERNTQAYSTQITRVDDTREAFATVRGSVVFPFQKSPGIILVCGAESKNQDVTVKILMEKEIVSLGAAVSELIDIGNLFLVYEWYCLNTPETEAPVEYYRKKTNWDPPLLYPAPHSEDFEYGVLLINEYLESDRLSVLKDGILTNQLMTNWEDINNDNRPHALIALACLLAGLEADSKDGIFASENLLNSCLVG